MDNYIPLFYYDVITNPYPNHDAGSTNLCKLNKAPCDYFTVCVFLTSHFYDIL